MYEVLRLMEAENNYDLDNGFQDEDEDADENSSRASCQPTVATYNTILRGLAQVAKKDADAAFMAEDALTEMMENYKEKGWQTKPNTRSWTHVIQAHGNSGLIGAGDRAENLLKRIKELHVEERERYEAKHGQLYNLEDLSQNVHQIVTPDERV